MVAKGKSKDRTRHASVQALPNGGGRRHAAGLLHRVSRNGRAAPAAKVVLYVLGGDSVDPVEPGLRAFPRTNRAAGESRVAHLKRVARLVDEAVADGGTHLVVPPEHADWLRAHPLAAALLTQHHELLETRGDSGVVFALRPREPVDFDVVAEGWQPVPGEGYAFVAPRRLVAPTVTLRPLAPARGVLRGRMTLVTEGITTLRLGFIVTRPDRRRSRRREVVFSLARVGTVFHDLPWLTVTVQPNRSPRLDFDLDLTRARSLDRIEIEIVEEDNWRVHPTFPGGDSFALPAAVPAGARLAIRDLALAPAAKPRQGPRHGSGHGPRPAPYRKPAGRRRDAVIFSSWVPRDGMPLGDYFLELLWRWHADSKIFVGVNHGSSPRWVARLRQSGLDVTIAPASANLTMPFDPTGFVAALDAYRRREEEFELVWFGHNKGGDHLGDPAYTAGRWTIERMFWSRRAAIERHFANTIVGLYASHYLMLLQQHLTQTDALARMYQGVCAPLHVMAVSSHYVMRDESVREFCAQVDRRFFRDGVEPFGGDRFFFEMAMPNVPLMQGYEPFIEPGIGGTKGPPKPNGAASILNDWRQNHAVVAIELEKWRQDPVHFRTRHCEHLRVE